MYDAQLGLVSFCPFFSLTLYISTERQIAFWKKATAVVEKSATHVDEFTVFKNHVSV